MLRNANVVSAYARDHIIQLDILIYQMLKQLGLNKFSSEMYKVKPGKSLLDTSKFKEIT
jgi:hypothetical protein